MNESPVILLPTRALLAEIDRFVSVDAGITAGVNKREELRRLVYEILLIRGVSTAGLRAEPEIATFLSKQLEGSRRFHGLKEILIRLRYPVASSSEKHFDVFLPRLKPLDAPVSGPLPHPFVPEKIFVQQGLENSALAEKLARVFPDIGRRSFRRLKDFGNRGGSMPPDHGKRDLYVVDDATDNVKPCPCTGGALGCNYFILDLGFGCPCDCSYCFLQHYANFPGILLAGDTESFFGRADRLLASRPDRRLRIGTGEFSDSLALDHLTGYSRLLVEFFRNRNAVFEFKTKTANIAGLLEISPVPENAVVSWSLNPEAIVGSEELYTASLAERLAAARSLREKGWKIGFHFDPVIYYPDWERDYANVIEKMAAAAGGRIAWISVGTLRFHRTLKPVVELRFPADRHFYGEFLLDPSDGKMRYPAVIRIHIYRKMLAKLKETVPGVPVYLCMEDPDVWKEVFGEKRTVKDVEASLLTI